MICFGQGGLCSLSASSLWIVLSISQTVFGWFKPFVMNPRRTKSHDLGTLWQLHTDALCSKNDICGNPNVEIYVSTSVVISLSEMKMFILASTCIGDIHSILWQNLNVTRHLHLISCYQTSLFSFIQTCCIHYPWSTRTVASGDCGTSCRQMMVRNNLSSWTV